MTILTDPCTPTAPTVTPLPHTAWCNDHLDGGNFDAGHLEATQ